MSKWHGRIMFVEYVETNPDVYEELPVVREYGGDLESYSRRWKSDNQVNDDLQINAKVSIIADPYAFEHVGYIRCVELHGMKWTVTSIQPEGKRLNLELGGIYRG